MIKIYYFSRIWFTSKNFTARLEKENLASNNDISNLVKKDRFWWSAKKFI